ncbi:putative germin-like protein 9-2 [Dendrobium catenatum]|uniref:Germin-like protein n=1 Tax=Dendrobium catenatum TaxID=906689 RepID=A0A2I0VJP0_9ASPA|nr:putative germin-like protein 9-2 [Dendrobium catenatum]PKU63627.1 Germin-like protein 9-3 [Dendrobium catenatum]
MAMRACLVLIVVLSASLSAHAGDPDITSDFITPPGSTPDGNFFTFTGLKDAINGGPKGVPFKATKASQVEFPALTGQSVSLAVLQYEPGHTGINPPHIHPRSAELLLVIQGAVIVGLVDSTNKLYTQTLYAGDAFIFPKGLVHFQVNGDSKYPAIAVSAFGSASPGTVSLPKNIFGSGIYNWVLAQSFKTDVDTINKLVSANS